MDSSKKDTGKQRGLFSDLLEGIGRSTPAGTDGAGAGRAAAQGSAASTLPWPPRPEVPPSRVAARRPPTGETEGLCDAMPEIGALPYSARDPAVRRVVRLVSSAGDRKLSIELQPGANKIGRQRKDNHIVLVSADISRFHAQIVVSDDAIVVTDLGSSNGTFVNRQRIKEQRLQAGDVVSFSEEFSFQVLIDLPLLSPETLTLRDPGWASGEVGAADTLPEPMWSGSRTPVDPLPAVPAPGDAQPDRPTAALLPEPVPDLDLGDDLGQRDANEDTRASPLAIHDLKFPPEAARTLPVSPEVVELERERRQLAVLYQVSKRCMMARTLEDLDRLLINVLERMVAFHRAFITYRLPHGDWKLVMAKHRHAWERAEVRQLLHLAVRSPGSVLVEDSRADRKLGGSADGCPDTRLLIPLRVRDQTLGAIFLVSQIPNAFEGGTRSFLDLFAEIAALALDHRGRLYTQSP